ncbi:MAG: 3-phosphoshikimate 1-carboxyvinyltransferase [Promethearchaeota archaeon]|nr:MAG: 3-phosphoshikimate 1-carboxyvinyltransferase [Candidatus Lokiarchaeota archaeon]
MKLLVNPTDAFNGEIKAPSSKSYSHRAFFAASLSNGGSHIINPIDQGDVKITIQSLKLLGANFKKINEKLNEYLVEKGINLHHVNKISLNCKNSGTTVRFLTALSLIYRGELYLYGEFFKKKRPILPLLRSLEPLGVRYDLLNESLTIKQNKITCKTIKIPGNISSQFISSLLFICPLIQANENKEIKIEVAGPIVSFPYIKITLDVLNAFGIKIYEKMIDDSLINYQIPLNQEYNADEYQVPGDFSSIAFIIAAGVLSPSDSFIKITNVNFLKPQGDRKFIEILRKMGAHIEEDVHLNTLMIEGNINKYPLTGIEIDVKDIPDLFPILAVIGAHSTGSTTLYNALNLRYKESDRIEVTARELTKMGVMIEKERDKLIIHHCRKFKGIVVNHYKDHRIAMAFTIAALFAESSSEIADIEIINDSYPGFINDLLIIGADLKISDK